MLTLFTILSRRDWHKKICLLSFISLFILPTFSQTDFRTVSWSSRKIGNVQMNNLQINGGSMMSSMNDDRISIGASGMGIMGMADHFHFVYKPSSCNTVLTAKLDEFHFTASSPNARAGLMIRQGLGMDMPYVAILKTTSGQLSFQFRSEKGAGMNTQSVDRTVMPIYLRLTRNDNLFEAFTSMDGISWMSAGSMMINMATNVNYGIAISSANQMMSANASFTEVNINCMMASVNNMCGMPQNPLTQGIQSNRVMLNWNTVVGSNIVYEYRFRAVDENAQPVGDWMTSSTQNTNIPLEGLMMDSDYVWQVRTICENGMPSSFTEETYFRTMPGSAPPCMMPHNRRNMEITSTQARIVWDVMGSASGYEFRYRQMGTSTWINGTTTNTSMQLAGLMVGTSYEWQVRSICATDVFSPYSPSMLLNTLMPPSGSTTTGCTMPPGRFHSMLQNTSARINWATVENAESYEFRYRMIGTNTWLTAGTMNTTMMISGLMMNTTYQWQVRSLCSSGMKSSYSPIMTFTTLPGSMPTGMIAYYPFNATSGEMAMDMRGDNIGLLQNFQLNPWMPMDGNNGTLSFDGKNDYVAITNLSYQRDSIMETSVALWVKTVSSKYQVILGFDKNHYYRLEVNGSSSNQGKLNFAVKTNNGTLLVNTLQRIDDGEWHFVVAVFDRGVSTIYLDGELDNTKSKGNFMGTGMKRFGFIGCASSANTVNGKKGGSRFEGSLDELRIYDEALSAMRVTNMYRSELPKMRNIPIRTGFYVEGECGTIGQNWKVEDMASGMGQYATIKPGINAINQVPNMMSDRISYSFDVNMAGMYNIFMRAQAPDEGSNSFWIKVNEGEWFRFNKIISDGNFNWNLVTNTFMKDKRIMFRLEQGMNRIQIAYREDGAKIDKMFLSMGPWQPLDVGPSGFCNLPAVTSNIMPTDIFLEAECGEVGDNWQVQNMPSGMGQFIGIKKSPNSYSKVPSSEQDRVTYRFYAKEAGMYNIFFRVKAQDGGDSFWLRVNKSNWIKYNDITEAEFFLWDQVHNSQNKDTPMKFRLEEGPNIMEIAYRENSTYLDKIFLTLNDVEPLDEGPISSCRPVAPTTDTYMANDIFVEAECGVIGQNWKIMDMASGMGQFATVKKGATSSDIPPTLMGDRLRINFQAKMAGMYNVFTRVKAPNAGDNSFWIRVNEGNWVKFNKIDLSSSFIWDQVHNTDNMNLPMKFRLEKGMNTIDIAFREDGTQLDKLFFSMGDAQPANIGPMSSCDIPPMMSVSELPSDIFIEAECGMVGNKFALLDMPSGMGQYAKVKMGFNAKNIAPEGMQDRIRLNVSAMNAGMYNMFLRARGQNGSNSFWIRVNQGNWVRFNKIPSSTYFLWDQVHDSDNLDNHNFPMPVKFRLEEGSNIIDIAYREEQTELDKVFLSMGANEPMNTGPVGACGSQAMMDFVEINEVADNIQTEAEISLYPNPAINYIRVSVHTPKEIKGNLSMYDIRGKIVYQQSVELNAGKNSLTISTQDYSKGIYIITYKDLATTLADRIIIAK